LAAIDANFARSALTLTTKDFPHSTPSPNPSTLRLALGSVSTTFPFMSSLVPSSTTLLSRNSRQIVFEMFYQMVLDVVDQNAGPAGRKFFPLIFTTFTLILFRNLLGMIPHSSTATSHLIVTFSMALAIFIGINTSGTSKNGTHFLSLFFPPGAPLGLAPFLVLIEPVTYIFKVLSLAIRLFANPMSGHTLPKTPSTLGRAAVGFRGILITPLVIISLVTGSETAIGSSQAYTFPVLLRLYTHDAIELH
jgi:ATP synthase subunit 6